jgi:hypothetical protein
MSKRNEPGQQFPADLEPIVTRLLDKSTYTDPLNLDFRKQRLLARLNPRGGRRTYMRARIATVLAVIGLVGGSGGAFAVANSGGSSTGGAASHQYKCHHHKEERHPNKPTGKCDKGHDKKHDH